MTPLGALLLAATATVCSEPATTRQDECERLLRSGRIVSTQKVAEGITGSNRVELQEGDARARAIFKVVDNRFESKERIGSEEARAGGDSWKHEVAAYEVDKLLGLKLVPTVVERKISGKRGSLQAWVERPLARFGGGSAPPDARTAENGVQAARLLDYLIYNRDRHLRNLLFAADWRPIAIDNSIAFPAFVTPYRPLYRFPRAPIERLEVLSEDTIKKALGRYLARDEMKGLLKRCHHVRELFRAIRNSPGQADALFDW
jgi:hypothetical protein